MSKSYAIFHDGCNDLGDRSDGEGYPYKDEQEEALSTYLHTIQHWTLSGRTQCYFCKGQCKRVSLQFPGGILREQQCGLHAEEFQKLNPTVVLVEAK